MKLVRVFATDDGGSSMEEMAVDVADLDFVPGSPVMGVSEPQDTGSAKFLRVGPGWVGGWHPTPARQYMITVDGHCRVETTDGKATEFRSGDIMLLEDTEGRGHNTTLLSEADSWFLAVALE